MVDLPIPARLCVAVHRESEHSWLGVCSRWIVSGREKDQHESRGSQEGLAELTNASLLSFAILLRLAILRTLFKARYIATRKRVDENVTCNIRRRDQAHSAQVEHA